MTINLLGKELADWDIVSLVKLYLNMIIAISWLWIQELDKNQVFWENQLYL